MSSMGQTGSQQRESGAESRDLSRGFRGWATWGSSQEQGKLSSVESSTETYHI